MPIYEYECEKCHETFELLQSIHDAPIRKCPQCSGKVRRIVSAPAILFKGSGFHVTDYRPGGKTTEDSTSEKDRKPGESPAGKEKKKPDPKSPSDSKTPPSKNATERPSS